LSQNETAAAATRPAFGVAVDMGASHLRFALADQQATILEESRAPVNAESGALGVIAQIRDGIRSLLPPGEPLLGIGIGVPGAVHPETGKVFDANNVPGWQEVDLGRELAEAFQAPVFLDNDANMAAIGEHWRGIAKAVDHFVFIALGTGIGAGIFVNGKIVRGANGAAGEIYRMNVDWTRWAEDFPNTGHLEAYASGMGLAAEGRKLLTPGNGSGASSTLLKQRDARYVFEALHAGDPQARTLVERAFAMLGVGVANLISVLDPEMVVFNGGVVQGAPELLLETVERVVHRIHGRSPAICLSTLGDRAQIWGALSALLEPEQRRVGIRPEGTSRPANP
jgi:glucokinase